VKPRQETRHRRYKADCGFERGARSGDERALDRKMVDQRRQAGDPLYEVAEDRESADEADASDEVGEVGGERAPSTSGVGFARRRAEGEAGAATHGAEAGAGHGGEDGANGDASVGANGGDGSTGHEARRGANAVSERRAGSTVPGGSAAARVVSEDPAVRRLAAGADPDQHEHDPNDAHRRNDAHGRTAAHPKQIPTAGWRDIFMRVVQNIGRDNTSLVAAGIGLNALLAVFPALAVLVSVYGMFASPGDVATDLGPFLSILPGDASKLLTDQLQTLTTPKNHTLGFGAIVATIVALWNSRQGMSALMTATNIAYNQREQRGFLRQTALSIGFSVGAMFIFLVMLLVGVAVPLLLQRAPIGQGVTIAILVFRWVLLWSFAVLGFSLAYRYAPDRQPPKWRWVTWGSAIAATVWILGSLGFAAYVQNFGSYGKTYGALGGVIVLLMWFYLMGFTIVLGAEINAEMEHQTAVDTTEGPPAPMGQRGAYVADTLGKAAR
jgi:membrane protein